MMKNKRRKHVIGCRFKEVRFGVRIRPALTAHELWLLLVKLAETPKQHRQIQRRLRLDILKNLQRRRTQRRFNFTAEPDPSPRQTARGWGYRACSSVPLILRGGIPRSWGSGSGPLRYFWC